MAALVERRNAVIDLAEQMIDDANKDFDSVAVELGRRINEVRAALRPTATPAKPARKRKAKAPNMEGLSEQEREMYRQLLAGKK